MVGEGAWAYFRGLLFLLNGKKVPGDCLEGQVYAVPKADSRRALSSACQFEAMRSVIF